MRIAIVGAGISGLVAAHRLREEHEVTVFEANPYAGGHTNTITVETPRATYAVDTGFIVFNDRNYPGFEALLDELGVASHPSDMSFGVSDGQDFEYAAYSARGLYANPRHLVSGGFQRMVLEYVRFNREARALMASDADPSLAAWLADKRFSQRFVDGLIVPQAAAVWSADPAQMETFPARFLVEFFDNHGMLGFRSRPQWRVVTGGSRRYVQALTAGLADLRLSTPVTAVERFGDRVEVTPRGGPPIAFDQVVIAAHSDQAVAMLRDPSPAERSVLGAIAYQPNEAVLHTDASVLPRRRRAWASWNYHLPGTPTGLPTVTYWMNRLQSLNADRDFCVTLNHTEAVDPAKVIRTISYAHPVFTSASRAAQDRHAEISGVRRTHFCGAYWSWGFHEDGVQSALRVARAISARGRARPGGGGSVTASALYAGTVRHRRFAVRGREFRHTVTMAYLDLDELPALLGGRLVARRPGLVRVRAGDLLADPRGLVAERTGRRPTGPVRVLTTPRVAGIAFNPVSFYYCFDADDRLDSVIAEVTNTPWGERHAYVVEGDGRGSDLAKALHVSPFMGMDQRYALRAPAPGATASVHIESTRGGERAFDATLNLRRAPLTYRGLARAASVRTLALIYGHGVALKLRGVPHHPHPGPVAS